MTTPTDEDFVSTLKAMVPYSRAVCMGIVQECHRRGHAPDVMGTTAMLSWRLRVSPDIALQYVERKILTKDKSR